MKAFETKQQFIELRAAGNSFDKIAKRLHISKATCTSWDRELSAEIATLKRAELASLYEAYFMTKKARIERLGSTLNKINDALETADLSEIDPVRLLEYKLKYMTALKDEYISISHASPETMDAKGIMAAMADLITRVQAGDITAEQAQLESSVLAGLLRAYDTVEVKAKLDALESIVSR